MFNLPNTIINLHEIRNIEYLRNNLRLLQLHYRIISLHELEQYFYNGLILKNSCHITFDDGHMSFYTHVFPLILKYRIPVSIYVSPYSIKHLKNFWFQEIEGYNLQLLTDIINRHFNGNKNILKAPFLYEHLKRLSLDKIWQIINRYQKITNTARKPYLNLTLEQLKEIKSSGLVSIGAHTLNHPILKNESNENATIEIIKSIEDLSELLNSEVQYFAYPNGRLMEDFGNREIAILKKTNIKLAFSTEKQKILHANPLCIPRSGSPLILDNNYKQILKYPLAFAELLLGENMYYKLLKRVKQSKKLKDKILP